MSLYLNTQHIVWNEFGGLEPANPDWTDQFDYWEDYVEKFFHSNGMTYDPADSNVENWLMSEDRAPFSGMVEELLPVLKDRVDVGDTDAILFAHWLPDLHLGTSVTNFAMHKLKLDNCFGFAISDRGLSAPFFAFDSLYKYLLNGRKRGLLIVADQKHVMYKSDLVEALSPANSATILHIDTENQTGLKYAGYLRHVLKPNASKSDAIRDILASLALCEDTTHLIGSDRVLGDISIGAGQTITDNTLVCSAPFAALSAASDLSQNYVLLCQDDNVISALGFEGKAQ